MDRQMDEKSVHSTGLCPLLGALTCFPQEIEGRTILKIEVVRVKGTADHAFERLVIIVFKSFRATSFIHLSN